MSGSPRRAARLLVAAACVLVAPACGGGRAVSRSSPPASPPAPSLPLAVTPRPPGPPVYHPAPHFTGQSPYDLRFAMAVSPYHGLTYGSRFTVVLTVTSNEPRPVVVSTFMAFGKELVVQVVDRGGGELERLDNHDPSTNGRHPFHVRGITFADRRLEPGVTRMRAVVEVADVRCPGGGDFITEIAGGISHVIKRGSNGGRHLVWVDNDPGDYATHRLAQGARDTAPPPAACRAESVE